MTGHPRVCGWCHTDITGRRADAIYCSKRCRQAANRFHHAVGTATRTEHDQLAPLRLAYADPPYPGLSARYYRNHPDYAGEVDHAELIGWLDAEHDGWALSTSQTALQDVLGLCPAGVRVAVWVRGGRAPGRRWPVNVWEPVIYRPGRGPAAVALACENDTPAAIHDTSRRATATDALIYTARPRTTDPHRVIGAKPGIFARWVFELLGALPGDQLTDVFPGSGGITRAWQIYTGHDHENLRS